MPSDVHDIDCVARLVQHAVELADQRIIGERVLTLRQALHDG